MPFSPPEKKERGLHVADRRKLIDCHGAQLAVGQLQENRIAKDLVVGVALEVQPVPTPLDTDHGSTGLGGPTLLADGHEVLHLDAITDLQFVELISYLAVAGFHCTPPGAWVFVARQFNCRSDWSYRPDAPPIQVPLLCQSFRFWQGQVAKKSRDRVFAKACRLPAVSDQQSATSDQLSAISFPKPQMPHLHFGTTESRGSTQDCLANG
jgi:hypothetical protein